jgi:hypothetical protein
MTDTKQESEQEFRKRMECWGIAKKQINEMWEKIEAYRGHKKKDD